MNEPDGVGFALAPTQGQRIDLRGYQMTVKASHDTTGGSFSLLEASEPPGFGPPLHIHHDAAEAFYVLEGEYTFYLDDREFVGAPGAFIYIPAGMAHGFRVGSVPSRKLNLYVPAAMVGYFEELSRAGKDGPVDPDLRSALAFKYSMEVLGPVPEG